MGLVCDSAKQQPGTDAVSAAAKVWASEPVFIRYLCGCRRAGSPSCGVRLFSEAGKAVEKRSVRCSLPRGMEHFSAVPGARAAAKDVARSAGIVQPECSLTELLGGGRRLSWTAAR